jgi:hypothetical protein
MAFDDLNLRARNLIIELLEAHESGEYTSEFYVESTREGWVIKLKGVDENADKELRGFTEGDLIQLEVNNYLTHDPTRPGAPSHLSQKTFEQFHLSQAASSLRSRQAKNQRPSHPSPERTAMDNPIQRDQVFVSYSHKDRKILEQLQTHLKPFVRGKKISVWDDTKIKSGDEWRDEINKAIASAKVAVLLVSPDFLASDFIAEHELPPLLDAAQNEGLRILWVAVRHSSYEETEIARYQCVNAPGRPLMSISGASREKELVRICKEIKAAVTSPLTAKTEIQDSSNQTESTTVYPDSAHLRNLG